MNMFFTKVGQQLYDIIGSSENNTVGYAADQIFATGYAEGGLVGGDDPLGVNSLIKSGMKGVSTATSNYDKTFKDQMTMGHFIHNNFGTFFKASDSGGTNKEIKSPIASTKPTTATDPNDYYARWYDSMRKFAQAAEVAQRGQTTIRSR